MGYAFQLQLSANLADLNPIIVGESQCEPGMHRLPDAQKSTLIHYVCKGTGTVYSRGGVHTVGPGQAFIILPDEHASYHADEQDPWFYRWVGFTGTLSGRFAALPPVFDAPADIFHHAIDLEEPDENLAYQLASDLFLLYSQLIRPQKHQRDYIRATIDYVQSAYSTKLTLKNIADHVGMNPDYLSRMFRKKTGTTLQAHILDVHINEAKRYLIQGYCVKEAATMCGFGDPATFTRLFKKSGNPPPTQWRKEKLEEIAAHKRSNP